MQESKLDIIAASDLEEAAEKIVKVVRHLTNILTLINKTTKVILSGILGLKELFILNVVQFNMGLIWSGE